MGIEMNLAALRITKNYLFVFILILLAAISFYERLIYPLPADTSALIGLGEVLLDGGRQGVDFYEVNPPASIFIYMPGIVLARLIGVNPDTLVVIFIYIAVFMNLYISYIIIDKANLLNYSLNKLSSVFLLFIFTVYFEDCFSQREHIVAVLMLPFITLASARLEGKFFNWTLNILIGVGLGIACSIKPYFIIIPLFVLMFSIAKARSVKVFCWIELWVAAIVCVVYVIIIALYYRDYILIVRDVFFESYAMFRLPFMELLLSEAVLYIFMVISYLMISFFVRTSTIQTLCALVSIGFFAVFFIQGRGWSYHLFPAIVFISFASIILLGRILSGGADFEKTWHIRLALGSTLAYSIAIALTGNFTMSRVFTYQRAVEEEIIKIAPNPTMLTLSANAGIGHPIVRDIKGKWVGSFGSVFMALSLNKAQQKEVLNEGRYDAPYLQHISWQINIIANDIQTRKPTIILNDDFLEWRQFILSYPQLAKAMQAYKLVKVVDQIEIWKRVRE